MKLQSYRVFVILLLYPVIWFSTLQKFFFENVIPTKSSISSANSSLLHKKCNHVEWTNFPSFIIQHLQKNIHRTLKAYICIWFFKFFTPCPHFFHSEVLFLLQWMPYSHMFKQSCGTIHLYLYTTICMVYYILWMFATNRWKRFIATMRTYSTKSMHSTSTFINWVTT